MRSDSMEPVPIPPFIHHPDNPRDTQKYHRLIDTPLAQILQILGILILFFLNIIVITDNLLQREEALTKLDNYITEEKPTYKKLESEMITVINDQYNALIRTRINTLKDFIQRFLDIYVQARKDNRHLFINELFVKITYRAKKSFFENFTQDVRDLGLAYWTQIDGFNLEEYLATFGIRDIIHPQDILPNIQRLVGNEVETGLIELAHYIMVLDLYKDFTCHQEIISKLIKTNNLGLLGCYIKAEVDLQKIAVKILAENKNVPKAVDYIKTYDLNPEDFPHLLRTLQKNGLRYHQTQGDWMAIEERLSNSPKYLALYVEQLIKTGEFDIALSIITRHKLSEQDVLPLKIQNEIAQREFDYKENRLFLLDGFTATEELLDQAETGKYLNLKEWGIDMEKDVIFIDDCETEIFKEATKVLLSSKEVGLDSEFKLSLSKFDESDMALLQLATHEKIYLFDHPKLKGSPKYIAFIQRLMSSYKIAKVGHTLTMDLRKLEEGLGGDQELIIRNRVEISNLFLTMYFETKCALAYITNYLLKKPMSKYEQMSNWNKRPLRKSQMHYAAFDAFILLKIYDIMKDTIVKNNEGYTPQEKEEIKENHHERKMEIEIREKFTPETQPKIQTNEEIMFDPKIEDATQRDTNLVVKVIPRWS